MSKRKFRAWHKDNAEMIYFNPEKTDQYVSGHFYRLIHSDDNIMMQFTGLIDSKGNDIYEGDILNFNETEWGGKFDNETVPRMTELVGEWPLCGSCDDIKEWRTVVGNIHQIKRI